MTSTNAASQDLAGSSEGWFHPSITGALHGFLAEGAVAEALFQSGATETEWVGQQRRPHDVETNSMRVDAKFAFIERKLLSPGGSQVRVIGFMGSTQRRRAGQHEARQEVSHYGLALLEYENLGVVPGGSPASLEITGSSTYCVLLVPADLVNAMFAPAVRQDGVRGAGANIYADLAVLVSTDGVEIFGDRTLLEVDDAERAPIGGTDGDR